MEVLFLLFLTGIFFIFVMRLLLTAIWRMSSPLRWLFGIPEYDQGSPFWTGFWVAAWSKFINRNQQFHR
ncbi:hypothetical protein [uncultured Pseudodesulfovibrio sp.]|uniref:hypothetical protein n=1 Tax=uncultured Pseudodesulfovibrio sp. TaxID=2035858 RepID=UPI0029C655C5|nr:hypothetical protein [uncultured Pseudodesulfovibrio sp.]